MSTNSRCRRFTVPTQPNPPNSRTPRIEESTGSKATEKRMPIPSTQQKFATAPDIDTFIEAGDRVAKPTRDPCRAADECCRRIAASPQQLALSLSRLRAAAETALAVRPDGMRTRKWLDVLPTILSAVHYDLEEDHGHVR
jgi:hypothetical protein